MNLWQYPAVANNTSSMSEVDDGAEEICSKKDIPS